MGESSKAQLNPDLKPKLVARFMERLKSSGYKGKQNATLKGKSGAEHSFDIVARKSHGFVSYTIAVGIIEHEGDQEIDLSDIFTFDNKCYDCGIQDKVLIALPRVNAAATGFAQSQQINVLDKENLEAFLSLPPRLSQAEVNAPLGFKTKLEFLRYLIDLGYKIKEKFKINGKSGAEYAFDILAVLDEGFITHRLLMEVMTGDEVSLNQVSLFDSKAYDVGIYKKVLLTSGELSAEAKQFAQRQRMKVIKLGGAVEQPLAKVELSALEAELIEEHPQAKEEARRVENTITEPLAEAAETKPEAKLLRRRPQPEALQLIPEALARRFNALPIAIIGDVLQVAMANPTDIFALEILGLQSKMRIAPVAADEREIREFIDFSYKTFEGIQEQISRIPAGGGTAGVIDLVAATADTPVANALNLIIEEATKARASDIHLEPEEDRLRVRFRIDGTLQNVMSLTKTIHLPLISRVKIMANMNIADQLRPQDGQISTEVKGRAIDIRVASSPTVHGEMVVLRLLDKMLAVMDLPQLGFSPEALAEYEDMLRVPFGMISISGPTGSGKTTTLYASVNRLDRISRNIVTIEDPVEYRFDNINQIQVNPRAGVTFASGLRAILRLDPDVMLVGEIRDADTARIAIQSALTGHLVLSSIHANDAVGVIFRLLDLGIEPFLVASVLIGIVAQRMVRRICPNCSRYIEAPLIERMAYAREMGEQRTEFLYGAGCELCGHTGYRERTALFEVLPISDNIRMQILNRAGAIEIRRQAIQERMVPLIKDGMLKVKAGITTISEVLRTAYFIE
jgi:general secretion pathway protein E